MLSAQQLLQLAQPGINEAACVFRRYSEIDDVRRIGGLMRRNSHAKQV
jgi:hypothetical protein